MEILSLLETKIKSLVELVTKLKDENAKLQQENARLETEQKKLSQENKALKKEIESFEGAIVQNSKNLDELSQEKVLTKMVVDDLIKSIDSLVEKKELS